MKTPLFALIVLALSAFTVSGEEPFNENFTGWVQYLSEPDADPADTWSYSNGVVHCTGNPKGYLRTENVYSNYQLHVEWRWAAEPGNSGVLLHIQEQPDKAWPLSIESQLKSGNAGDFYVFDGATFNELKAVKGRLLRKQQPSNEKAPGEWNEKDIVCDGDTITITVNGQLQNRATGCTLTSGTIGLQSEGAPIEFRNLRITPLP